MKKCRALCCALLLLLTPALAADLTVDAPAPEELPALSPTDDTGRYLSRENAAVMVTASEETQTWYFSTLTKPIMNWCCLNLKGQVTFSLLKDLTLCADLENTLYVPTFDHNWANGDAGVTPVPVFDLGGRTLTFEGTGNLLFLRRVGAVVKNGRIIMKSSNGDAQILKVGLENGPVATDDGVTPFKTELHLENVHLYNFTGSAVETNVWGMDISVKNSLLYSPAAPAVTLRHSTQSTAKTAYEGEGDVVELTVEDSILLSGSGRAIHIEPNAEYAVSVKNSLLLGTELSPKFDNHTKKDDYCIAMGSAAVTGTAAIYGEVPAAVAAPVFTAVSLPPAEQDAKMGVYPIITEASQIPKQTYSSIGYAGFAHTEETELLQGNMLTDGSAVTVENPEGIGQRIVTEEDAKQTGLAPGAVYAMVAAGAAVVAAGAVIVVLKPKKEGK